MRGRAFRAGDGPLAGFSGLERVADALNNKNNDAQELESAHWLLRRQSLDRGTRFVQLVGSRRTRVKQTKHSSCELASQAVSFAI